MADVPSAQRVLQRAWVHACLVGRGFLEGKDDVKGREATRREVVAWFDAMGLEAEAEPGELAILKTPIGKLAPQTTIDCFVELLEGTRTRTPRWCSIREGSEL